MTKHLTLPTLLIALLAFACSPAAPSSGSNAETVPEALTIYSSRHYDSDRTLYQTYEAKTGVKIQVREAGADQLLETMKAEGENSPADLIIAADAGGLWRFQSAGLTQAIADPELNALVPENLRQADGHWFGLAKRVRIVAYDPGRFSSEQVDQWLELADETKRGEICVRSSSNIYNLSLMAELITRIGSEDAGDWASGIVANMARNPQGGDTDQVRAVAAGECGIAIVNHYYWVRLATSASQADRAAAAATRIVVPRFPDGRGAHINITGAAVTASTAKKTLATDFIKFLLTNEGQALLTVETKELPILSSAALPEGVEALPPFKGGGTPLETLGENQAEAQRLYDLAGWN